MMRTHRDIGNWDKRNNIYGTHTWVFAVVLAHIDALASLANKCEGTYSTSLINKFAGTSPPFHSTHTLNASLRRADKREYSAVCTSTRIDVQNTNTRDGLDGINKGVDDVNVATLREVRNTLHKFTHFRLQKGQCSKRKRYQPSRKPISAAWAQQCASDQRKKKKQGAH